MAYEVRGTIAKDNRRVFNGPRFCEVILHTFQLFMRTFLCYWVPHL